MEFISLCRRGANQLPCLYKSEDGRAELQLLTKAGSSFDEDGEILGVVYAPDIEDSDEDIADAAAIKKIQRDSTKAGFKLDLQHDGKPLSADRAWLAENMIIAKGDERFRGFKDRKGTERDVTGGWGIVVKVEDAELRRKYRSGEWDGFSMAGPALVEPITKADTSLVERFLKALAGGLSLGGERAAEDDMKIEELNAALAANNEASATAIVKALTTAGVIKAAAPAPVVPPTPAPDVKPVVKFEGDPMDPKAVAAHREKLAKAKLAEGVDWGDSASVDAYNARLAEHLAKSAAAPDPNAAQIAKLEEDIRKLKGQSSQPTSAGAPAPTVPLTPGTSVNGITKAQQDHGSNIAKLANERRFGKRTG